MLRPGTVHLWEVRHRCHFKWRLRPYTSAAWTAYVSVGTLGTGEWYVCVVEILYHPAAIVGSEEEARARAAQWMDKLQSPPGAGRRRVAAGPVPCDVRVAAGRARRARSAP